MQIDLANTLFTRPIFIFLPFTTCEAHLLPLYSLLLVRFIFYLFTLLLFIARKLTTPLLRRGWGRLLLFRPDIEENHAE